MKLTIAVPLQDQIGRQALAEAPATQNVAQKMPEVTMTET